MTARDGSTPLSPDELEDLIPSLANKQELNEWERENILQARAWALRDRTSPQGMISDDYIRKLHRKMFDQTWKWAGEYRQTERNIGIPFCEIRERLVVLFRDIRYWIDHSTFSPDETAVRLHHRLVVIHPFPNGNGRHSRLMADVLVRKLGRPILTWGSRTLVQTSALRTAYIRALRAADDEDVKLLLEFVRS